MNKRLNASAFHCNIPCVDYLIILLKKKEIYIFVSVVRNSSLSYSLCYMIFNFIFKWIRLKIYYANEYYNIVN